MPVAEDDPRLRRCGFAKLLGDGLEYYVKKYEVTMGRRSKSSQLDVVLGDNMNISRKHACIRFNFEKGAYELIVLGKNGVTVGSVLHTPNSPPLELRSQDFVQMGDRSFYFLLPKDVSRLGPTSAKQRRLGTHHNSPSTRPPPTQANGASDAAATVPAKKPRSEQDSESPQRKKRKQSIPDRSPEASDIGYDLPPPGKAPPGGGHLAVSGTGMQSREAGHVEMNPDREIPGDKTEASGSPALVFTDPAPGLVRPVQLYRPRGGQPFC